MAFAEHIGAYRVETHDRLLPDPGVPAGAFEMYAPSRCISSSRALKRQGDAAAAPATLSRNTPGRRSTLRVHPTDGARGRIGLPGRPCAARYASKGHV